MRDNDKPKNEAILDVMLYEALEEQAELEYTSMAEELQKDQELIPSDQFMTRMERVLEVAGKQKRRRKGLKTLALAAVVLVVLVSTMTLSVLAYRAGFFGFILSEKPTHANIQVNQNDVVFKNALAEVGWPHMFVPSDKNYLNRNPQIITHGDANFGWMQLIYEDNNEDDYLILEIIFPFQDALGIDSEQGLVVECTVMGEHGFYRESSDDTTLVWLFGDFKFIITTSLDIRQALDFANSLVSFTKD